MANKSRVFFIQTATGGGSAMDVQHVNGAVLIVDPAWTHLIVDVRAAPASIQLPNPAVRDTPLFVYARGDAQANPLTLLRFAAESIDDLPESYVYLGAGGSFQVVPDGTNWWIF